MDHVECAKTHKVSQNIINQIPKAIFSGVLKPDDKFPSDKVAFYTESKCVTSRWFSVEDKKETKISTWKGAITRK
jgi:hypothetical protein